MKLPVVVTIAGLKNRVIEAQFHWEICSKIIRRNVLALSSADVPDDISEENLAKIRKLV